MAKKRAVAPDAPSATGTVSPRFVKTSVSLPATTLERAKERAGAGGLSAYVAEALEHEERRLALAEYLADAEAEHGPIPDDVLEEVRQAWPAARAVL